MTIEGYCMIGRSDEPMKPDGFCVEHDMVGIPPTWGSRLWRWEAGTWKPYRPRPEGWVWRDPVEPAQKAKKPAVIAKVGRPAPGERKPPTIGYTPPETIVCAQCGVSFESTYRGRSPRRYCGEACGRLGDLARKRRGRAS